MSDARDHKRPIRIGISTCLLGQKVRYDAGHKHDRYITEVLGQQFAFVPVCPEIEVGMGVPREPVHLIGDPAQPAMVGRKSGTDWTEQMKNYAAGRVKKKDFAGLSGYILKKDSPSCGMARVKVFAESGIPQKTGTGLFASALLREYPLLPVEEEGRLNDAAIRENFIVRVFSYHRFQEFCRQKFSAKGLVDFHTRHKYLLMAHSVKHYKLLGQLVADVRKHRPTEIVDAYGKLLMEGLAMKSTVRKNVNVLQHILGYFKKHLDGSEKQSILQVIEDYHTGLVPLIVPISLFRYLVRKYGVAYIEDQIYLNPHPKELMLRNHV